MQLQEMSPACHRMQSAGLQSWRQQLVTEYIELHMRDPIRLPHLAAAAGLTRMHFAAQFRIATGIRPHHYIQLRRIEKACELLRDANRSVVEVALSVGFQTQPHFSRVFRRLTGGSPTEWRLKQRSRP